MLKHCKKLTGKAAPYACREGLDRQAFGCPSARCEGYEAKSEDAEGQQTLWRQGARRE